MTVVLDTNLTEELIEEGNERELVSKIQTMRKEAGFEVTDRIEIFVQAERDIEKLFEKGNVAAAVLADKVTFGAGGDFRKGLDINRKTCTISISKAK